MPREIVAEIDGDFRLERRFHALFLHCHDRREWFHAAPELQAVIAAINDGSFDAETLPNPASLPRRRMHRGRTFSDADRYELSVKLRTREVDWKTVRSGLTQIAGERWFEENWLDYHEEIEAFIVSVGGKPSKTFPTTPALDVAA